MQSWPNPVPLNDYDLPAFPVDALPGVPREYVEALAHTHQVPVDLPAVVALTCTAASLAKRVEVHAGPDWYEPCNLYTLVALPPAHRKSTIFKAMTAPLEQAERMDAEASKTEVARAVQQRDIVEAAIKAKRQQAAKAEPDQRQALIDEVIQLQSELPDVPSATRLLVDDVSPERLAGLLADNGGRIALMSAEGGAFDMMAGRYSNGQANLDVYLKGHAGDTLRVDRIGREAEFVVAPALTLGVTVQPDVLQGLANKPGFRGRGLIGRILYSLPPSQLGHRAIVTRPVDPLLRSKYEDVILELLELPPPDEENGQPHALRLAMDAQEVFIQYRTRVEQELGPGGRLEHATDWGGKLPGAVARIAGILHALEFPREPWTVPISRGCIERAIRVGDYFTSHALAALDLMGSDPALDDARYVLAYLQRNRLESTSQRALHQAMRGRFKRAADLQPALAVLEERAYLLPAPEPEHPGTGRRPSPRYLVNPAAFERVTQNAQNTQNAHPGAPTSNGPCVVNSF